MATGTVIRAEAMPESAAGKKYNNLPITFDPRDKRDEYAFGVAESVGIGTRVPSMKDGNTGGTKHGSFGVVVLGHVYRADPSGAGLMRCEEEVNLERVLKGPSLTMDAPALVRSNAVEENIQEARIKDDDEFQSKIEEQRLAKLRAAKRNRKKTRKAAEEVYDEPDLSAVGEETEEEMREKLESMQRQAREQSNRIAELEATKTANVGSFTGTPPMHVPVVVAPVAAVPAASLPFRLSGAFGTYRGTCVALEQQDRLVIVVYADDSSVYTPPIGGSAIQLVCGDKSFTVFFVGVEFRLPGETRFVQVYIIGEPATQE